MSVRNSAALPLKLGVGERAAAHDRECGAAFHLVGGAGHLEIVDQSLS
jgi:hypothetical protein